MSFWTDSHVTSMKLLLLITLCALYLCNESIAQSIQERMQKGLALLQSGDVDGAQTLFLEVIRENPSHGPARLSLGQIALERCELKDAQEQLEIATTSQLQRPQLAWQLLGKVFLFQHNYEKARYAFLQSLQTSPDFIPAMVGRTQTDLFLHAFQSARDEPNQLLPKEPPEANLLIAEYLIFLGRTDEARERLEAVISKQPSLAETASLFMLSISQDSSAKKKLEIAIGQDFGRADTYLALGMRYHLSGNRERAMTMFQIAFQLDDQNPVTTLFLQPPLETRQDLIATMPLCKAQKDILVATNSLKNENYEDASLWGSEILVKRPLYIPASLIRIEAAEKQGNLWDALATYRQLLEWLPDTPDVLARFAALARKMEIYDLAECSARRAIEVQPELGSLHYLLASILKDAGKVDAGIESCERAIQLGFQEAPVYVTLGDLYYEKMAISKSIAAMEKAVELDPIAAENIASFALSALTTNDYAALRRILEKNVEANPESVNTLYSLGVMCLNENQLAKAKDYFIRVQKLAPRHSQVYYNLGLVYSREGMQEEAQSAIAQFQQLKAEEQTEWLKHNRAHKMRIDAAEALRNGNVDETIRLYSTLISEGTAEPADLIALAQAYLKIREYSDAYSWFEKALQRTAYNKEAIHGLIETAEALDKPDVVALYRSRLKMLANFC